MTVPTPEPTPTPQAGDTQPTPDTAPAATPPWGSDADFNPEKAWNLIQGLKADKEKLSAREFLDDDARAKLAEYDKLVEASKTDQERQAEELARWQQDAQKWRSEAVTARVQALAADFADPTDAIAAIDPAKYLDAGGQIDEAAITADLNALLERKPHWRRSPGAGSTPAPRVPSPHPAQGAGGGTSTADPAAEFAAILQGRLKGA